MPNTFNVLKSVISRLWNRYQQTLNFDDRPHSGRPRATTDHRIDSSESRLYEIDLKRQIKLLQTFIKLLVSELRVRQVEIMLDGPGLSLPWQYVKLLTAVNGGGSIRTRIFVAGHVSYFEMSPYSHRTSLTGVVGSGDDEMNDTPMSQCDFMTDLAVESVMVWGGITRTDIAPPPPPPPPYCVRKGHWAILPGQHTHTRCRPVCEACGSTFRF